MREISQESEKVWVIASSYTCVWKNSVLWGGEGLVLKSLILCISFREHDQAEIE